MKYSCTHCNSDDVQKVSVLLASGTQKTVTEETKRTGTILAPVTMMGDVKTGRKSVSVTESDLVKMVQGKLAPLEYADKQLLEAYQNEMKEHVKKMSDSIDAPELDRFEKYAMLASIAATAIFLLWAVFTQSGFGIFGMIVSALVSGVFYLIALFVFTALVHSPLMNFVQPGIAEVLDKQYQERKNAEESARKSGPKYPTLQGHDLRAKGFFCHTCGEIFIPQEL